MTDEQKTLFDISLLAFKTAKDAACTTDAASLDCTKANDVRAAEEAKRNTDGYYAKDAAGRLSDDEAMATATQALKA